MKIAYRQNLFPKIISLPNEYKDVDDLANVDDAKKLMMEYKEKSQDALQYIIDNKSKLLNNHSPIEKQRYIGEMFSIILNIDSYSVQNYYLNILSEKLSIAYEVLLAQFRKYIKTDGRLESSNLQKKVESSKYIVDRESQFLSLFYDDFLTNYIKELDDWNSLLEFTSIYSELKPDSFLSNILLSRNISEEQKITINDAQLWREYEL